MIEVLRPGLQTSVQDGGRSGLRHLGVGEAGAADRGALQLANRLLGNALDAAALEITLTGPTLRFTSAAWVALAGADIEAHCNQRALNGGRPFRVPAGARLTLGRCRRGARSYLAVAGGLLVEPVMGSASTDLGGGFGGHCGRALRRGDRLRMQTGRALRSPDWAGWAQRCEDPARATLPAEVLRFVADADAGLPADLPAWSWQVDARSGRKALRLRGPALPIADGAQRVSQAVGNGDIQVLPDGEPLLLGVEAQTVGGYPLLGRIIRADRDRLGQLRPGDPVRLLPVDLNSADDAWQALQAARYRQALALAARGA